MGGWEGGRSVDVFLLSLTALWWQRCVCASEWRAKSVVILFDEIWGLLFSIETRELRENDSGKKDEE